MKILFLGDPNNPLVNWLQNEAGEEVVATDSKIKSPEWCLAESFDFVISYNYKHIVRPNILNLYPGKIINLHISYLPYNRGMHPNVWSFVEGTPKGVTIHVMEAGLDTGDILSQKEVDFSDFSCVDVQLTFASTWERLQVEIQQLFKDQWSQIRLGQIQAQKQRHDLATFHYGRDLEKLNQFFEPKGWETPIHDFLHNYHKSNKKISPETQLNDVAISEKTPYKDLDQDLDQSSADQPIQYI